MFTLPYNLGSYILIRRIPGRSDSYVAVDGQLGFVDVHLYATGEIHQQHLIQISHVSHPNVSRVHDVGLADSRLYFVEDHIEGVPLGALLQKKTIPRGLSLYIVSTLSSILHEYSTVLSRPPLPKAEEIFISSGGQIRISLTSLLAPAPLDSSLIGVTAFLKAMLTAESPKDDFSSSIEQLIAKIQNQQIINFHALHVELTQLLKRFTSLGFMAARLGELIDQFTATLPPEDPELTKTASAVVAALPAQTPSSERVVSFYQQASASTTASHQLPIGAHLLGHVLPGTSYKLLRQIAAGGMGIVFEAEHVELNRKVALKVLHGNLGRDPQMLARFKQEARSAARIHHSNIVEIYDFGTTRSGEAFLVMEFLSGTGLDTVTKDGLLPLSRCVNILQQITDALEAAHQAGIIHCDLKPDNIMLIDQSTDISMDREQQVKVLDFGIAKLRNPGQMRSTTMTKQGQFFGTPEYMSPEQILSTKIDARADIYSLGCIAYELVTGKPPFVRENYGQMLAAHLHEKPVSPRKQLPHRNIPKELDSIIMKALQKDPAARFSSMIEFKEALASVSFEEEERPSGLWPLRNRGTRPVTTPQVNVEKQLPTRSSKTLKALAGCAVLAIVLVGTYKLVLPYLNTPAATPKHALVFAPSSSLPSTQPSHADSSQPKTVPSLPPQIPLAPPSPKEGLQPRAEIKPIATKRAVRTELSRPSKQHAEKTQPSTKSPDDILESEIPPAKAVSNPPEVVTSPPPPVVTPTPLAEIRPTPPKPVTPAVVSNPVVAPPTPVAPKFTRGEVLFVELPLGVSRALEGTRSSILGDITRCYTAHVRTPVHEIESGTFGVSFGINGDGHISSINPKGAPNVIKRCIVDAFSSARFKIPDTAPYTGTLQLQFTPR